MQNLTENKGVYILELKVEERFSINHEKFKDSIFEKGYYYYFGSAQKNLRQRIERHLKKYKKQFWHIDYLTCNKKVMIQNIFFAKNYSKIYECILVENLLKKFSLQIPIKRFGNSDCNSCDSHLLFSPSKTLINQYPDSFLTNFIRVSAK